MTDRQKTRMPEQTASLSGPDNRRSPISVGLVQIHEHLTRGGMAEIYRGTHTTWGAPVAVKVLPRERADDQRFWRAFKIETMALTRLNHSGVVKLLDWGKITRRAEMLSNGALVAGHPYLALEYLGGGSLADRPLPTDWWELQDILLSLLGTLAFIHRYHIVHRDLSLGNLLCGTNGSSDDPPKLIDFGLADVSGVDRELTTDLNAGTPAFQAPEVILTREKLPHGPWTDLYSLGCIAYYLASGELPFDANSPAEMDLLHLGQEAPSLENTFPVPSGYERWVMRLLAKSPERRPQSAAEAGQALCKLTSASRPLQRTRTLPGLPRRSFERHSDYTPTDTANERQAHPIAINTAVETPNNGLPKIQVKKGRVHF